MGDSKRNSEEGIEKAKEYQAEKKLSEGQSQDKSIQEARIISAKEETKQKATKEEKDKFSEEGEREEGKIVEEEDPRNLAKDMAKKMADGKKQSDDKKNILKES